MKILNYGKKLPNFKNKCKHHPVFQSDSGPSCSRKRTPKHYSKRHQRRVKKQRVTECTASLSWLEDEGLTPVKVIVMNNEDNQLHSITLRTDLERALDVGEERISDQDMDMVTMILYVKDKYHISGSAYHPLCVVKCHGIIA